MQNQYSTQLSSNNSSSNLTASNNHNINAFNGAASKSEDITNPIEIRKRRDAFRMLKVHESNGHEFVAKFFSQFTFCSFCSDFLWYFKRKSLFFFFDFN